MLATAVTEFLDILGRYIEASDNTNCMASGAAARTEPPQQARESEAD
jgi:hypothetical protein